MDTRKATVAAGMILSLTMFAPITFAQGGATVQAPRAATEPPQPPEKAPQAPGSPNAETAEGLAQSVAMKIHDARREGKDVKNAEAQEKQGEAALRAGYKSEALAHFRKAEISLNENSTAGNSAGDASGISTTAPAKESH